MRKQRRSGLSHKQAYSEAQLAGLRTHALAQKQTTVDRLRNAIEALKAKKQPISIKTIREECGLEYNSIKRNAEALRLYQEHSTYLSEKRKRIKTRLDVPPPPRDSLLAYKKTQLVAMLREERRLRQEAGKQQVQLLQDYVQKDVKIAQLEAELAQYHGYLERLRISIQQQEHGNSSL
jgi:hypothetical protein